MSTPAIIAIVVAAFLAIFAPPMWWCSYKRKFGERREKKWGAILLGILLFGSLSATPAQGKVSWVFAAFALARVVAGVWPIAFGAKGSPAKSGSTQF